jgi:hypothetical protein
MRTNNQNLPTVASDTTNWPELLAKTVDDLSGIARTEIELLEVTLKRLIEAQTDKIAGMVFLLVALTYGSLFLLGGIVLLIHLWLAWWLAFLITGVAIAAAGVLFQKQMAASARSARELGDGAAGAFRGSRTRGLESARDSERWLVEYLQAVLCVTRQEKHFHSRGRRSFLRDVINLSGAGGTDRNLWSAG